MNLDGVTGNVETWVDQIAPPVTFSQLSDPDQPTLNPTTPPNIETGLAGTGFLSAPNASKHQPSTEYYWASWLQRTSNLDRNYWSQWDAGNVEIFTIGSTGGGTLLTVTLAETPTVLATIDFANSTISTNVFMEMAYNGALAVADRCQIFFNRVRQVSSGGTGTIPTALNSATPLTYIAAFQAVARMPALFYNMYTDLLIPTDTVRDQLFAFEAP